ncbi:MAG: hypothetical protein IT576_05530, partial [Verrucomicrobiales bacterium]|nr:hypothetical protein [Verrucomicrobiales bacterium]
MKSVLAQLCSLALFAGTTALLHAAPSGPLNPERPRLAIFNGSSQPVDVFWLQ